MSTKGTLGFSFNIGKPPVQTHIPLRIIILGPFSGTAPVQFKSSAAVTKHNLAEVCSRIQPALEFLVDNRLNTAPVQLPVQLSISSIDDFLPANIITRVPELQRLHRFIDCLQRCAQGDITPDELEQELRPFHDLDAAAEPLRLCAAFFGKPKKAARPAPPPISNPPARAQPGAVDKILDMVETTPDMTPPNITETTGISPGIRGVIAHIGMQRAKAAVAPELAKAIAFSARILADQLNAILHHPQFQATEATWRGLKFLVNRTDFRQDIVIEIIAVKRAELEQSFHSQFFLPEGERRSGTPASLVVLDFDMTGNTSDIKLLQAIGSRAAELQTPVLFSVKHDFFGLPDGAAAERLSCSGTLLQRPEYENFNALREKECARWLAAAFNPFLLRPPYTKKSTRELEFIESIASHNDYLWGRPIWALSSLITRSFAQTGWPTEITGADDGQVDNLDIYLSPADQRDEMQIPIAAPLTPETAEDLAGFGIIPLICRVNRDSAYVLTAPVVRKPPRYGDRGADAASRIMCTLPYQLLVARIAAAVTANKSGWTGSSGWAGSSGLMEGNTTEIVQQRAREFLTGLLADTGPGARVDVRVENDPHHPERTNLLIQLHTGGHILGGVRIDLEFGLS